VCKSPLFCQTGLCAHTLTHASMRRRKKRKPRLHSFSVTIFTLGFRLFFILLQINLNLELRKYLSRLR
jgi:hypothetical protein